MSIEGMTTTLMPCTVEPGAMDKPALPGWFLGWIRFDTDGAILAVVRLQHDPLLRAYSAERVKLIESHP